MTYQEQLLSLATKFTAQLAPDMEVAWNGDKLEWLLSDDKAVVSVLPNH